MATADLETGADMLVSISHTTLKDPRLMTLVYVADVIFDYVVSLIMPNKLEYYDSVPLHI